MPPTIADRARSLTKFNLSPRHRPPGVVVVAAVTVLCAALSLLADELIVRAGTAVFPATRGYVHFQFGDYAKLTVIGVVAAGIGWPIVARLTSDPRWAFLRLAVAVTAVCLLPDLYIWLRGQPGQAVLVLVAMHLAIGLITYNLLVRLAPVRPEPQQTR
ncbi:MAG TPA: DUF6069 family protein [Streptosporangiaceae bacterium]|jgi:uncharacterized membrane protein YjjP (DUF1212 family)